MEVQTQEREILYLLRVAAHEDNAQELRNFATAHDSVFSSVTARHNAEVDRRFEYERKALDKLRSESTSIRPKSNGGILSGANSEISQSLRDGRAIESSLTGAAAAIDRTKTSYDKLRASAKQFSDQRERDIRIERETNLRQGAAEHAKLTKSHERIKSRETVWRDTWDSKKENATQADLTEGTSEWRSFMERDLREQERILKNRQRLVAQTVSHERREREQAAAEEASLLRKRQIDWARAEDQITATRERASATMDRANDKLAKQLIGLGGSAAHLVRGFALMGLAGEENSQKLVDGLMKAQAGFDLLMGGAKLFLHLKGTMDTYRKAVEAAATVQKAEADAAELARQKSVALGAQLEKEAAAANVATNAHRGLSSARTAAVTPRAESVLTPPAPQPLTRPVPPRRPGSFSTGLVSSVAGAELGAVAGERYGSGAQVATQFTAESLAHRAMSGGLGGTAGLVDRIVTGVTSRLPGLAMRVPGVAAIGGVTAAITSAAMTAPQAMRHGVGGGADPGSFPDRAAGWMLGRFNQMLNTRAGRIGAWGAETFIGNDRLRKLPGFLGTTGELLYHRQQLTPEQAAFSEKAQSQQKAERAKTYTQWRMEQNERDEMARQSEADEKASRERAAEDRLRKENEIRSERLRVAERFTGRQADDIRERTNRENEFRGERHDKSRETLTRKLDLLESRGMGLDTGNEQARRTMGQLQSVSREQRRNAESFVSGESAAAWRENSDSMRLYANEAARAKAEIAKLVDLRRSDPSRVTEAEVADAMRRQVETAEKLSGLSRDRARIERQIHDDRRHAINAANEEIERQNDLLRQSAERARERVSQSAQRFADMEPEEQKRLLQLSQRVRADRQSIAMGRLTQSETAAARRIDGGIKEVADARDRKRADLQKTNRLLSGPTNRQEAAERREWLESRKETAQEKLAGLREREASLLEELRSGGASRERRKEIQSELKSTRSDFAESRSAARGRDKKDQREDLLATRRTQQQQLNMLDSATDYLGTHAREAEWHRAMRGQQDLADTVWLQNYERQKASDPRGLTDAHHTQAAGIYQKRDARIAGTFGRDERQLAGQVDLPGMEPILRASREQAAQSAGFGALQQNVQQRFDVAMRDNLNVNVTIDNDRLAEEMTRQMLNAVQAFIDRSANTAASALDQKLAEFQRAQSSQFTTFRANQSAGARGGRPG